MNGETTSRFDSKTCDQFGGEAELKPCPFCGGPARMESDHNTLTPEFTGYCHACDFSLEFQTSQADAITAWNRRSQSPQGGGEADVERVAKAIIRAGFRDDDSEPTPAELRLARAAIAAMPQSPPTQGGEEAWQPIETAPRDGTPIWIATRPYNPAFLPFAARLVVGDYDFPPGTLWHPAPPLPAAPSLRTEDVHTYHCFQGEYEGCCKYGDPACTAAPSAQARDADQA